MSNLVASLLLLLAFAAQADEIYKWVDKAGKTHYSSRKEDAEGAATTTMRPGPSQPVGSGPPPAARAANEDIIRRSVPSLDTPTARPTRPPAAQAAAGDKPRARNEVETDAVKCALARDILAGNAEHTNGAPIDAYDRQTAEADVRMFCRK